MAATISHIATNPQVNDLRGLRRGANDPLQHFTEAKKYMTDIYNDLGSYINELGEFYTELEGHNFKFAHPDQAAEVKRFKETISSIKEMVGRDKMKVVIFGRTSNGKSSVVNAMLHSKILPQGMGHTTCCFIQIEGSEEEKYFHLGESKEKLPVSELDRVGHAGIAKLDKGLGSNTLIRVFYPKSASKLLQNDVVIVDSPGIDVNREFDTWIDTHCLDADVFVLVSNSESTLTQAEKNFFNRVSTKLSKPNIFILNNRWDASASETEELRQQIRNQHEQRFIEFLHNELNVCSVQDSKNRLYFISAKEILEARLKAKGELKTAFQVDGFNRRLIEFEQFEEHFEKCISKSAIQTKFEAHTRRANEIIMSMRHNLDELFNSAIHEKQRMTLDFQLRTNRFAKSRESFKSFEKTYLQEIRKLRTEAHLKVLSDFNEEIARLESIIDRFSYEFNDDPKMIDEYKTNLASYVNKTVSLDLENQYTGALMTQIWSLESNMNAYAKELLGTNYFQELDKILSYKKPFKFNIIVDCSNMVEDFHEDLEFRFSLGVENIARWILSTTRGQPITAIDRNVLAINPKQRALNEKKVQQQEIDLFISNLIISSASYLVNGSVGIAIGGLIIYKNVDWRWIVGGISLVSGLYAYERWKWNTGAKEERLKRQFRGHLEQRLHHVETMHVNHCETQVVNELDQVYEGIRTVVGQAHRDMKQNIDASTEGMKKLDEVVKNISTIKNKTNFVSSTLEGFAARFLNGSNS